MGRSWMRSMSRAVLMEWMSIPRHSTFIRHLQWRKVRTLRRAPGRKLLRIDSAEDIKRGVHHRDTKTQRKAALRNYLMRLFSVSLCLCGDTPFVQGLMVPPAMLQTRAVVCGVALRLRMLRQS